MAFYQYNKSKIIFKFHEEKGQSLKATRKKWKCPSTRHQGRRKNRHRADSPETLNSLQASSIEPKRPFDSQPLTRGDACFRIKPYRQNQRFAHQWSTAEDQDHHVHYVAGSNDRQRINRKLIGQKSLWNCWTSLSSCIPSAILPWSSDFRSWQQNLKITRFALNCLLVRWPQHPAIWSQSLFPCLQSPENQIFPRGNPLPRRRT